MSKLGNFVDDHPYIFISIIIALLASSITLNISSFLKKKEKKILLKKNVFKNNVIFSSVSDEDNYRNDEEMHVFFNLNNPENIEQHEWTIGDKGYLKMFSSEPNRILLTNIEVLGVSESITNNQRTYNRVTEFRVIDNGKKRQGNYKPWIRGGNSNTDEGKFFTGDKIYIVPLKYENPLAVDITEIQDKYPYFRVKPEHLENIMEGKNIKINKTLNIVSLTCLFILILGLIILNILV